jgi:hypothetical protein
MLDHDAPPAEDAHPPDEDIDITEIFAPVELPEDIGTYPWVVDAQTETIPDPDVDEATDVGF